MNDKIDIIVMWVNFLSSSWKEEYDKYRDLEIKSGVQTEKSLGAFGEARYRDWGIFKYWFRGVAENCPWVNKVFLVVEDETHIPSWLNKECDKLRIVYHKEFIPNDLLPLFTGPCIELWYSNIPDLSENFIACDDDYMFMNHINDTFFFENNIPKTDKTLIPKTKSEIIQKSLWLKQIKNCNNVIDEEFKKLGLNDNLTKEYKYSHLPEARKKSFEKQFLKDNYNLIHNSTAVSHFRCASNFNSSLYINLMKVRNISKDEKIYKNSRYSVITDSFYNDNYILGSYDLVCFNDVDYISYSKEKADKIISLFNRKFPKKCYFEL